MPNSCPTCNNEMQSIGVDKWNGRNLWCQMCGTVRNDEKKYVPLPLMQLQKPTVQNTGTMSHASSNYPRSDQIKESGMSTDDAIKLPFGHKSINADTSTLAGFIDMSLPKCSCGKNADVTGYCEDCFGG